MNRRRLAWLGFGGLTALVGGCQLVSGLSGYRESSSTATGAGGSTASSASGTGGMAGTGGTITASASVAASGAGGATTSSATGTGANACGGQLSCGGVCVDQLTDSKNCGSCAHVCAGLEGWCASGVCATAGPYEAVTAISANAKAVYWTSTQGTSTVLHHSEAPDWKVSPIEATLVDQVGGIAVAEDGLSVFFTRSSGPFIGLYRWTPLSGAGGPVPFSTSGSTDTAGAVHIDGDRILWGAHEPDWKGPLGTDPGMPQWFIYTTSIMSGQTDPLPRANQFAPRFAEDSQFVYWQYATNQFIRAPPVGLLGYFYTTANDTAAYLAADNDPSPMGYLYAISSGNTHDLYRVAKGIDAAMITPTSSEVQLPDGKGLVVSGSYAYWVSGSACTFGAGNLGRIKLSAWSAVGVENVIPKLTCPRNLTVGGGFLYYSEGATDNVHVARLPIPAP